MINKITYSIYAAVITMGLMISEMTIAGPLTDFERSIFTRWAADPGSKAVKAEYLKDIEQQVEQIQQLTPMTISPFTRLLDMQLVDGKVLSYKYESAAQSHADLELSWEDAHTHIRTQICQDEQARFFMMITGGGIQQYYFFRGGTEQFAMHYFTEEDCVAAVEPDNEKVSV